MKIFAYALPGNWPLWMLRCQQKPWMWEMFWADRRYRFIRN